MGTGILICGLNGAGKSTLGKALADMLHFHFIDIEDLYFPKTDPNYMYASSRTQEEVEKLLFREVSTHNNFVLASVHGNYGTVLEPFFQCAVLIEVPKSIRLRRVRERSFQKFGTRVLPGGDLYDKEENFFDFVKSRPENMVEKWLDTVNCPVIRIDGRNSIEENIQYVTAHIQNITRLGRE